MNIDEKLKRVAEEKMYKDKIPESIIEECRVYLNISEEDYEKEF